MRAADIEEPAVGWVERRPVAFEIEIEIAAPRETQRHKFKFMIVLFCREMLGFSRVQNGFYPTYK
jgi:hypothetical protein